MIVEEQISARQQRARKAIRNVLTGPAGQAYGDYVVQSASGREYRVAMRGPSVFENFCSSNRKNSLPTVMSSVTSPCGKYSGVSRSPFRRS
jgi:hypothetical protein